MSANANELTLITPDGKRGDAALIATLSSKNAVSRIMARAAANGFTDQFTAWINDEHINRRTEGPDLLHAVAMMQLQTYASIVAGLCSPGGDHLAVKLYIELIEKFAVDHIRMTRSLRDQLEDEQS